MDTTVQGHDALMDRVYRRQRYFYDFTRKYYLFGRDRLIAELNLKSGARLIEVGCGTARNLIAIAKAYPSAKLYGLDASAEMLKTAARAIEKAGLSGRIKLVHGFAESLSPAMFGETEPFDDAIFSYSLSMIPDWRGALVAAEAALVPGGRVHIVDFGDLAGLGRVGNRLMRSWLAAFHVTPRDELLKSLEHAPAGRLRLLPGRYAFLLTKPAGRPLLTIVQPVAHGPQGSGKSAPRGP
ncbi:MAG TPA: methyltransferase domain-containing protein [Rhizomicrobium sp.]|nr:methyltransferase domain-containing protein [Rhizomicrobium sp.]